MDEHDNVACAHVEHRQVPGHEEADTTEDVRQPDPDVGLARCEALGEGGDETDREQERAREQHGRLSQSAEGW